MPIYRGSWYSQLPPFGWFDKEDKPGSNALGVPDAQQGIALPNRGTLGQWYNVTPPGGSIPYPMQQTDVGPAKWTGRGVDISAAAAHQMGYTPKNFPTDVGWKVEPRDEPRGLGSPAGMPVQAGDLPDNAAGDTAYAGGPPQQQGRRMPDSPSLMDMFQPRDIGGKGTDLSNMLQQRSNSLIGLGLGLMAGTGFDRYGRAMQGYAQGANTDQARYQAAQTLAEHRADRAQAQSNWQQQFARGNVTEAQKAYRDIYGEGGTPEQKQAFMARYYEPKTEGDWKIAQAPHPIYPGETVPVWANSRTQEVRPFQPNTASAGAPNSWPAPGQSATPVYGADGYRTPSTTTAPAAAAPADGVPPAPPGSDPKEWRKEQTKLMVQKRIAEELRQKQAGSIDPVTEDIDRAINETKQYPGMIAGAFGNVMKNVPGSRARNISNLVDTIKANASLDKLQSMRAASPTGASGLGAVTQGEHKILQDAIGALDQSQTPDQFLYNLDRVKRIRHEVINGPGTAPPPQFELPEAQRPSGAAAGGPPKPGFVKKGYVFKGGDPSQQDNWAPVK